MDVSVASSEARLDLDALPEPSAGRASGRAWHSIRETGRKLAAHVRLRTGPFSTVYRPFAVENGHSFLFAKLNHEIRTPLNAIIGFSELFLHQHRLRPCEARALIENVLASGQRLLSIVEAILDPFHGIDLAALDKLPLNLRALLSDTFAFLERQIERSRCTCILLAEADLFVEGDSAALRHMLLGLLSSALRHADAETLIIVSAQPDKANTIVDFRCKGLAGGFGDECDRAHLALINALALAHGGRLGIDGDGRATTIFRLTFFATSAVH